MMPISCILIFIHDCRIFDGEGRSRFGPARLVFVIMREMLYSISATSSTAQGGGGSFKKRKTIGEIGCCESRMSKQNTDQLTN